MAQIIMGDKSSIDEFPFLNETKDMADFIISHPEIIGPDVIIMEREFKVPTVSGHNRLDFLAYDIEAEQVNIVELKNTLADEKVLLQTLRYANWIKNNPDTIRYQIKKRNLDGDSEEIATDSIKVIIVARKISRTLAELCQYISGFEFELIELQRFKDSNGKVYAVTDRVEPSPYTSVN